MTQYHHSPQIAPFDPGGRIGKLIEQILFVSPGERVNRPDFGSTLNHLPFASRPTALTTAIEALVQGALRKWAGPAIRIVGVDVAVQHEQVSVTVRYVDPLSGAHRQISVSN